MPFSRRPSPHILILPDATIDLTNSSKRFEIKDRKKIQCNLVQSSVIQYAFALLNGFDNRWTFKWNFYYLKVVYWSQFFEITDPCLFLRPLRCPFFHVFLSDQLTVNVEQPETWKIFAPYIHASLGVAALFSIHLSWEPNPGPERLVQCSTTKLLK